MSQYIRESEFSNVPDNAYELTRKRHSSLRLYYDASGVLQHAYSYDTCIFTRLPNGRAVMNWTRYSVTTSGHQNEVSNMGNLPRPWYMPEGYDRTACDVVDAYAGITASALRERVTQHMSYPEDYAAVG